MANKDHTWKSMCWGDLATLEYGKGLREYKEGNESFPVFGTNGQIGWHSEYLYPKPGVIVGRKGAYRGIHFSKKPFFVIDTAFYLKPKDEKTFDIRWAYYQLLDFDINKMDSGSAIPSTSREAFYAINVQVPTIITQRKIAAILSAYDDLIENNLRRIKILEEMAQMIYREWFVNFRFPGHHKVKMVNSPLGKIPEGWEVSTVGENIIVVPRKNKIKTSDYLSEGVIPVIDQGKNFIAGYIDDTSLSYDGPLPIIVFGDHTCVLKWVDFRFAVGADGTQLIHPKYPEKLSPRLLFYSLQFVSLEQFGYQRHFKYLKEAKIIIPSVNLSRKFEEVVSPYTDLILNLQRQNLSLRQTRDLLLPKLISGELDVSELDITIPEDAEA